MNIENLLSEKNCDNMQYYNALKKVKEELTDSKNNIVAEFCDQEVNISDDEFRQLTHDLINFYNMTVWKYQHGVYNSLSIEPLVLESRICIVENITRTILNSKSNSSKKFLSEIIAMEFFSNDNAVNITKHTICEKLGITVRTFERNIKYFYETFFDLLKKLYLNGDAIVKFIYLAEFKFGIDGKHVCKTKVEMGDNYEQC